MRRNMDPQNRAEPMVAPGRPEGYSSPTLTFHGSVGEHTAANHAGAFTDAAFPAHTPATDLTFSG